MNGEADDGIYEILSHHETCEMLNETNTSTKILWYTITLTFWDGKIDGPIFIVFCSNRHSSFITTKDNGAKDSAVGF